MTLKRLDKRPSVFLPQPQSNLPDEDMDQGETSLEVQTLFLTSNLLHFRFNQLSPLHRVSSLSLTLALFLQPVGREPLVYHLDAMSRHSADQRDPPDEFFEVTMDDVRKRFAQLKSERWEKDADGIGRMALGPRTVCDISYKYRVAAETRLDQMCSCTVCTR